MVAGGCVVTWLDLAKPFYKVEKFQVKHSRFWNAFFVYLKLQLKQKRNWMNEFFCKRKIYVGIALVLVVTMGCFLLLTQENHLYVRYILYFRIKFHSLLCLELLIFSSNLNIYLVFWQSYEGRRLLYKENRFSICNYQRSQTWDIFWKVMFGSYYL